MYAESKTVSARVTHYSKYMLVSVPDYFFNIDCENEGNIITSGKADVVFVVDTTGSMGGTIRNVKNNINQFVTELQENKVDVRLGLVEYRDIYADGIGSTKSYDWYTDVNSFKSQLSSLGVSGGGDIPESAVDALYCAQNMSFRSGVKKYIILITDADYKDGIVGNESITMEDAVSELVRKNMIASVVTRTMYYSDYASLVNQTDGVTADITNNFVDALEPLILKMGDQVNRGCWVRLSNGTVVCLDKDPTLEDSSVDTDGDGISDVEELADSYKVQVFNPFTKQMQVIDTWSFYSDPSKKDTDGDGIRFYLDSKPISARESLFKCIYGRETDYYQQQGLIDRSWEKVSGYEANGFFKGTVLSEADIVYSFDQLRVCDIYTVIDLAKTLGIIVISSLIVTEVAYTVGINVQALTAYISHYGVKSGVQFYLTLGAACAPATQNSLMGALGTELMDGDDDEYRLIDYVDDVIYTEEDAWALGQIQRGDYLDDVCGNNLVHNFPVIDKLENRVITSIKSIDTSLKSYQSASGIYNKIVRDARTLSKFTGKTWTGIKITPKTYDSKVLQIVLPNTTINAEQMLGLQVAELYVYNTYNIELILTVATK